MEALQDIEMAREISKVDQDLIPIFDGDKTTLKSYINACEFLIEEYLPAAPQNANDLRLAKRLLMIFMGKLRTKAREAVDANRTPTTWPELKLILIHSFGDKRSEEVLVYDLNSLVPQKEETTASYANKIKSTLYTLLSKINLEEEIQAIRDLKQQQYNQIALRTYLFGLDIINPNIGLEVKLRQPDDIETAEAYALETTNYNTQKQRFLQNHRQPTSMTRNIRPPPVGPQHLPPIIRAPMLYPQPNPNQNRFIPPAVIPLQRMIEPPRQMQPPPQIFQPFQQQGNRSGIRAPPQQLYRPTPMEVDSSGIYHNNKRPASSINKPPPKRQWMANNVETPYELPEDTNYYVQYPEGEQTDEYNEPDEFYENDTTYAENQDFQQDTHRHPTT